MLEATRVRIADRRRHAVVPGVRALLRAAGPGFQGSIGRRAAVLLTLLAAAAVLWAVRDARASQPARHGGARFLLSLATLTVTPTKWTQHFGDLAGYGAAVLVLGMVAWSTAAPRSARGARIRARRGYRRLVQRPVALREQPHACSPRSVR